MKKLIQSTAAAALTVSGILSQVPFQVLAQEPAPEVFEDDSQDSELLPAENGQDAEVTETGQNGAGIQAEDEDTVPEEAAPQEETAPEEEAKPAPQSDYDGLTGLKGNFERVENGYRLGNIGGNNHNLSDLSAKAFSFSADIEYVSGQNVSFMFGAETADPGNFGTFYGVELKNDGGRLKVKMFQDGPGSMGEIFGETDTGIDAADGNKGTLAVSVDDENNLSIAVNGQAVSVSPKAEFTQRYAGGYVGLLTWNTEAVISNIQFAGTEAPVPSFRTNLDNLHGLQGTWKETDEGLFSAGSGDNFAVSDTSLKNVEFSATITNKEKKGAGSIAIRCAANPRDGGYFLNADYTAGIFKLFSFPSGATVASAPMSMVPEDENGAYQLVIQMVDDQIRVFVNGVGIIDVKDTQHPDSGRLALLTWDTTVVYQDVMYQALDELPPMEKAGLNGLEILTEGVHLNEAVDPEITLYGLDVESQVHEFSLRPKGNGTITATITDRDNKLVRDLGEVKDTLTVTDEDFSSNFLKLFVTVTNDKGFAKTYTFTTNKWYSSQELIEEEYRPQFHVTPITNFMNDPNGMVYDSTDGYWHMFYQYQPHAGGDGNQSWGHVRSKDLVNWEQMPLAIQEDDNGLIFSGCAIEDRANTSGLFGDNKEGESSLIAYFTYHNTKNGRQSQAMAYSKDHGLTWTKCGIVLDNETWTLSGNDFRDPKVFQIPGDDDHWYMVTAGGAAQLFVSENLKDWTRSQNMTFKDGSQIYSECPMMFPAVDEETQEDLWVYGGSAGFYVVGQMEKDENGIYKWHAISDKIDVDSNANPWGGFGKYATMTFYNPDDARTIGVSWLMDFINLDGKGFKGVQSLPQSYSVKKIDGKYVIVSDVVEEVDQLRDTDNVIYSASDLKVTAEDGNILEGRSGITYDVEGTFDVSETREFGFRLRKGASGEIVFKYDAEKQQMILDLRSAGVYVGSGYFTQTLVPDKDGKVHLRLIVDQGAVEAFGNHGEANISTVLYTEMSNLGMEFFTDGPVTIEDLDIYEMKSMFTGESKAESAQTQLYLSGPGYAKPGEEFNVSAVLYPDKTQTGVKWEAPGLEIVSSTGSKAVLKADEAGTYQITASAGGETRTIEVRVADPNFENNGDNWQAASGSWTIDDAGLHGNNSGSGDCFYLNDGTISGGQSFTLSSNIRIEKGQAAGLVFGVRDRSNPGGMWYCANIDTVTDGGIFKLFENRNGEMWRVTKPFDAIAANEDGSYDMTVSYDADAHTLSYTVNGTLVGTKENITLDGTGYTGYVTYKSDACFNSFFLDSDADVAQEFEEYLVELDLTHTEEHFLVKVPSSLKVKMSNGTVKDHDVAWNTTDVQFGKAGTYKAYGTLAAAMTLAETGETPAADLQATVVIRNNAATAALEKAVEEAGSLKESDWTPESWKDFAQALMAAKAVLAEEDPAQADVDAALEALNTAGKALAPAETTDPDPDKADTAALEKAVEEAGSLKEGDWTPESWKDFAQALMAAKAVLAQDSPAQADVDAALAALNSATKALAPAETKDPGTSQTDRTKLEAAIKEAEGVKAAGYTDASWKAFAAALKDAKAVLEDENATQDQIDATLKALEQARKGLVKAGSSGSTAATTKKPGTASGSATALATGAALWSAAAGLAAAAAAFAARRRKKK